MMTIVGTDLREALNECEKSARLGYEIALAEENELNKVLSSAMDKIESAIKRFVTSSLYSPEIENLLQTQLVEIEDACNRLSFAFKEDMNNLKNNLSKFSITLFGRTMAGKSTLMEILTEGDGASIGKGAQRTTLDVRKYQWNGLEITDVPGIGAFEGEDDEQMAFEAAKTADLILFLITDDGPQAAEAVCFSKIVDLGKPIIGVMNVKKAIQDGKSLRFTTKEINKQFNADRLKTIKNQFYAFSEQYGQTWTHIPFVDVHLQSAFMSQKASDEETRISYHEISRIDSLKACIIEQVRCKGKFYRIKTFIDIISNPVLKSMENLLVQSQNSRLQGRIIQSKKRKLEDWKNEFCRDSKEQIQSLIEKIRSELNCEVAGFAEEHFEDENAGKAWEKLLKTKKLETKCQDLLKDFEERSNDKLKEVSRELTNELKFAASFAGDIAFRTDKIIDGKRMWDRTTVIASGGLSIASIIATCTGSAVAGPLGWAALAVSCIGLLGTHFFESRDRKEREARLKLENNLRNIVNKICETLKKEMESNLNGLVLRKTDGLLAEIDRINRVIFSLADTQKRLAWGLNTRLMELSKKLMTEAIRFIGAEGLEVHVREVARIPGTENLVLLNDGAVFPKEQLDGLKKLMAESIGCINNSYDKKKLISRIIGIAIDSNKIIIEENCVAYVPLQDVTPYIENRARLAQQFSRLLIMNQRGEKVC